MAAQAGTQEGAARSLHPGGEVYPPGEVASSPARNHDNDWHESTQPVEQPGEGVQRDGRGAEQHGQGVDDRLVCLQHRCLHDSDPHTQLGIYGQKGGVPNNLHCPPEGYNEEQLVCIHRALLLLESHLETFRKKYAFHFRGELAIKGRAVSLHAELVEVQSSAPLHIVVQPGRVVTEKASLDMHAVNLVGNLRAEIAV